MIHQRLQLCLLCLATGNSLTRLLEKRKQYTLKGRTIFGVVQLIARKMHIGAPTGRLATDSAKLEQWGGPVEHKQHTGRIQERFEPIPTPLEIFRLSLSALYSISTEIARNQRNKSILTSIVTEYLKNVLFLRQLFFRVLFLR